MGVNDYPYPLPRTSSGPTSSLFLPGGDTGPELPGGRCSPYATRGSGSPPFARHRPQQAWLVLLLVSPSRSLVSSSPRAQRPGPGSWGTTGRRARRAKPTWARRSVVAAAAPLDPLPIAPRRTRHLLNPLSLGRSRPLGPREAGPIGQKLPRTRAIETAQPGVPAQGLGARRLPSPQNWASPFTLVAPGKQPSRTKAGPRPGGVPLWLSNLCAPLTRVSFRRSRPRPAAAGSQREGAPALAGRAHGAAAFPFSSQRKCFGRQIIPGDMKLLRPPHVARKKNRNEHLWHVLGIPRVS